MTEGRSKDDPPFRFMYMSGAAAERDQTKKPSLMPEYGLLRVSPIYVAYKHAKVVSSGP